MSVEVRNVDGRGTGPDSTGTKWTFPLYRKNRLFSTGWKDPVEGPRSGPPRTKRELYRGREVIVLTDNRTGNSGLVWDVFVLGNWTKSHYGCWDSITNLVYLND